MLQKFSISRRLFLAILISLALHLLLAGGWHVLLPQVDFSTHVIQAELMPPPPKKPVTVAKKTSAKKAKPKLVKKVTSEAVDSKRTLPIETNQAAVEQAYVPAPMIGEDERPPYEAPIMLPAPTYVDTEFEVRRTGFGGGKARYRFDLIGEGTYRLQSQIEAHGLASLAFSGKRLETSVGKVTEHGLQPDSYRYEISTKPEKFQGADFDWGNHAVTLASAKRIQTLDLPDGTQDFLSFMYQFMFVPPLDRMQHTLTNGKTLHTIDYLFVSEDEIATQIGNLKTIHIAKSSGDADEKTELWLAVDYRYIPVKILKIAKDGSGYELVVTHIDTDISKND